MFKNYLTIAIRNILKHKFYSAINILGLTIGLAASLFIALYIFDELSYDKFHADAEKIYRVGLHGRLAGQEVQTTSSNPLLAETMKNEIPGIEHALRVDYEPRTVFKYDELAFTENSVLAVDSNFFEFFSFTLLQGDPKSALMEPHNLVVNERFAKKYFGDVHNAIGKTVLVGNENTAFKVTGVCANPPTNSHLQ
ncbi:MAG: ABC transporter permease, partial [Flammeovirgaceae bacterium]|nr:ABC transporter permease [Flammeovirgaceae bacterium]